MSLRAYNIFMGFLHVCDQAKMEETIKKIPVIKPSSSSVVPAPRSGHRCVADDKNLYVFGGYSPFHSKLIFCELWRFNLDSLTWTLVQTTGPAPTEVCSSCMLLDNGYIITYGGSGVPFGVCNSDKLHVFIIDESRWVLVEPTGNDIEDDDDGSEIHDEVSDQILRDEFPGAVMILNFDRPRNIPVAGYGQSMALSPDKELYVFSGTSGRDFFSCVTRFRFSTKTWSYIPRKDRPFIMPRYRHEAVTYGDRFFVIGGGLGNTLPANICQLDKVPSFCFTTKIWHLHECLPSEKHGFPNRRRCHGCVLFEDVVYISGGTDGLEMFDDIWSLDMKTFQWEKLPLVLPYPVYFHSTAVTPMGCMLTFGGMKSMDPENDPRSNDLSFLWLTQPTLAEMSLKVVFSCIPDIDSVSNEDLRRIGIPYHLIPARSLKLRELLGNC